MWFLGAGASAASNIPTAWDMIWEFKQRLYASQKRVSPASVKDLSNPAIRTLLQGHIDSLGNIPAPGDPDEYSALFEAVFPSEGDRRIFIDAKISGAKPSYGHIALATLMKAGLSRLVWTTNFDPLIADACAKVYDGTGRLTSISLENPAAARESLQDERWPIEIKLHGDFRFRRLKNTADELRTQDRSFRQIFIEACTSYGLVVAGYSGRDNSVMDALEEAVSPHAFPAGLFWLTRGDSEVLPRVAKLLQSARAAGVECGLVRIESFDESLRDLLRIIPDVDSTILDSYALDRPRWSAPPVPVGARGFPVVRFNAVPLTRYPTVCRKVVCEIGGTREVSEALSAAGSDAIGVRSKPGVLAFGSDSEVLKAFQGRTIRDFDLHTIEKNRLNYDSTERGLLGDALSRAIARNRAMTVTHRKQSALLVPENINGPEWVRLKSIVGPLGGELRSGARWKEGIKIRLEWASGLPWLLVEPNTIIESSLEGPDESAAEFVRQRNVKRYNRALYDLLSFWSGFLYGDGMPISAFGTSQGVDATFEFGAVTGFSKRLGA